MQCGLLILVDLNLFLLHL